MKLSIYTDRGVNGFRLSMTGNEVRYMLSRESLTKPFEPENDLYESEELIPSYDGDDCLEFMEIISISSAKNNGIKIESVSIYK